MAEILTYHMEYVVYKNIYHFCQARYIELDNYKKIKNNKIIELEQPIILYGKKKDEQFQIIYLTQNSKYYKKNEFAKIVNANKNVIVIFQTGKKITSDVKLEMIPDIIFLRNHTKVFKEKNYHLRKLDNELVEYYLNLYKIPNINALPKLSPSSIEAIWWGFKPGDVICQKYPTIASSIVAGTMRYIPGKIVESLDEDNDDEYILDDDNIADANIVEEDDS